MKTEIALMVIIGLFVTINAFPSNEHLPYNVNYIILIDLNSLNFNFNIAKVV